MSGNSPNTAIQSTLDPISQDIRSRDIYKTSQIGAKLSRVRRSPSPRNHASQGLLSQQPSSTQVTRLSPPVGQFVINTLLQIAGFVAAIAFGIYAVQSVTVGKDANQSADIANQLALLGLCMQSNGQSGNIDSICSRVIYYAGGPLSDIASTLFPGLPYSVPGPTSTQTSTTSASVTNSLSISESSTTTITATPTSTPTQNAASGAARGSTFVGIIVGSVIGGIFVLGVILFFLCARRQRRQRYATATPTTLAPVEKKDHYKGSTSIMQGFRRLFVETRVITESE